MVSRKKDVKVKKMDKNNYIVNINFKGRDLTEHINMETIKRLYAKSKSTLLKEIIDEINKFNKATKSKEIKKDDQAN